jgi:hypothetical protein
MSRNGTASFAAETQIRCITALACLAAFAAAFLSGPGVKPYPGMRTAFELLASDPTKRAGGKVRQLAGERRLMR